MKIEVTKKANKFCLQIDGETILLSEKLSAVVIKIEKYLKLRFLEEKTDSALERIGGFFGANQ